MVKYKIFEEEEEVAEVYMIETGEEMIVLGDWLDGKDYDYEMIEEDSTGYYVEVDNGKIFRVKQG